MAVRTERSSSTTNTVADSSTGIMAWASGTDDELRQIKARRPEPRLPLLWSSRTFSGLGPYFSDRPVRRLPLPIRQRSYARGRLLRPRQMNTLQGGCRVVMRSLGVVLVAALAIACGQATDRPATSASSAAVSSSSHSGDSLPSWNEGPAKRAILDFVRRVTREGTPASCLRPRGLPCSTTTARCGPSSQSTCSLPSRWTASRPWPRSIPSGSRSSRSRGFSKATAKPSPRQANTG